MIEAMNDEANIPSRIIPRETEATSDAGSITGSWLDKSATIINPKINESKPYASPTQRPKAIHCHL